jgi:hypothetical protein
MLAEISLSQCLDPRKQAWILHHVLDICQP